MNLYDRQHLLAEKNFLHEQLAKLPQSALLTRMSTQARLGVIEQTLAQASVDERSPARARLTFNGAPVIGSYGIYAEFGMNAVNGFTEAVATVAASLAAPLAAMGPIPNREKNQLLITGTAVGSFGFELEEFRGQTLAIDTESPVAIALGRTQALLQGSLGSDEELADIASETDPRALEKIRNFLKLLVDNDAVCTLQYGQNRVRFTDVGQVRTSLERLGVNNLHESKEKLQGEFVGALPQSRTFEFKLASQDLIIRGRVAPVVQDIHAINNHLGETVEIDVMATRVGNGRPRYVLRQLPLWNSSTSKSVDTGR